MAYIYKGKTLHIEQPATKAKCGTDSGYQMHRYLKTLPCQPCRDAHATYQRKHRRKQRTTIRQTCATYAGYMRHKRNDEEPCDYCRPAYAQYMRDYRDKKRYAA